MKGIYKFTCSQTNLSYIGQSVDIEKRYNEHRRNHLNPNVGNYNSYFYRALRKYSFDNFTFEIIDSSNFYTTEDLNILEQQYIKEYNSFVNGYNSTKGGEDNPSNNPEVVQKRTERLLNDPEVNKKLSHPGELNPNSKYNLEYIVDIRTRYGNYENKQTVFKDYSNIMTQSMFDKIWQNKNWKHIMPEVYEKRPIRSTHGSFLTELDIYNIRLRQKNGESIDSVFKDYQNLIQRAGFRKIWKGERWKDITV